MNKPVLFAADALAGVTILGSLFQYLPAAAALVGVVWYLIQIWESKTVQKLFHRNDEDQDDA